MRETIPPDLVETGHINPGHHPETEPTHCLFYWISGILASVLLLAGMVVIILIWFNRVLQKAVRQRTLELVILNENLEKEIQEQKQTEDALRDSEEKYRTLFNMSKDAIFLHNIDPDTGIPGKFIDANETALKWLEYSKEELLCINPLNIRSPDFKYNHNAVRQSMVKEKHHIFEMCILSKTGALIPLEVNSHAFDYKGKRIAIVIGRNITERKQAEEALQLEKDKAQQYFDIANVILLVLGADQRVVQINQRGVEILGCKADEIIGKNWFDHFLPENIREYMRSGFITLIQEKISDIKDVFEQNYDNPVCCKNGEQRIISWRNSFIKDHKTGKITGILSSGQDVTERRKAETALRESEKRYRTLFEHSPILLWEEDFSELKKYLDTMRASGVQDFRAYLDDYPEAVKKCAGLIRILDVNMENLSFFEISGKEEIPYTLPYCFNQESWEVFKEEVLSLSNGNIRFESEIPFTLSNGKCKISSLKLSVVPGYEKTLSRVLISYIDITRQKQAEEQLKGAVEEKVVLLREIHHRVKNNMQVLIYLMDMQAERITNPEILKIIKDIQGRITAMSLVHEKLYQSDNIAMIDFRVYIEELAYAQFHSLMSSRAISLHVDVTDIHLKIDTAIPCGLIVNELITNAIKYAFPDEFETPDDNCGITVSFVSESGKYILTVSDNGIGIPPYIDLNTAESLGLKLVRIWATYQLNGKMDVNILNGTKITIMFSEEC